MSKIAPLNNKKTVTMLTTQQGTFNLECYPNDLTGNLRAWDAADEYLLNTLELSPNSRLLIFNDRFGALAVALSQFKPYIISDSYLSQTATRSNLAANQLAETQVTFLNSLELPQGTFDYILIKAPKTLAFLDDFLIRIHALLHPKIQVIVAGMVKTLPASVWKLVAKHIGETTPSLAKKKARLIFATPNPQRMIPVLDYPTNYHLENTTYTIANHANVFSRQSLDIGTRFLLAHLPSDPQLKNIVDLGCGNGVVGLLLAEKNPQAKLYFIDESYMAIASAQQNFNQAVANKNPAVFSVSDSLTNFAANSMDLIVCNPPFHQQNTIGTQIALTMFQQAHQVLKTGGQLLVIGNRHLGYHSVLKKYFKHTKLVAANAKFVILRAIK
ncbi:MAG: methyltransferase [Methylococcales bacterium]|nr:methyltransferase [Methylococcales bacterium]